ncbi:MAG: apolipoprotein N-acyltransferase [Armatimonadota bacterium]
MNVFKKIDLSFFYMILSMVLLSVPFINFNCFPVAFFALIPFIIALRDISIKKSFVYSLIAGALFSLIISKDVIFNVHIIFVFITVVYCISLALFTVLTVYFYKHTEPGEVFKRILFTACVYVFIFEYLRLLGALGAGSHILAYSQYKFLPLIQIAGITGCFGVSWLVVFVNVFFAEMIYMSMHKRRIKPYHWMIPLLIILLCFLYGVLKLNTDYLKKDYLKASVIQTNLIQNIEWNTPHLYRSLWENIRLSYEAVEKNSDMIIWAEGSLPDYIEHRKDILIPLYDFVDKYNVNILAGSYRTFSGKYFNSAFSISPGKGIIDTYSKNKLFPFGEYNPFRKFMPGLKVMKDQRFYTPGSAQTVFDIKNKRFSVLICMESLLPDFCRNAVLGGAQFLVVITNDEWFTGSSFVEEHLAASVLRAVENRVYLIQAANTGYSAFIDPCGYVYNKSRISKEEVLTDNVYITEERSVFTYTGNMFILINLGIIIFLLSGIIIKTNKKKVNKGRNILNKE